MYLLGSFFIWVLGTLKSIRNRWLIHLSDTQCILKQTMGDIKTSKRVQSSANNDCIATSIIYHDNHQFLGRASTYVTKQNCFIFKSNCATSVMVFDVTFIQRIINILCLKGSLTFFRKRRQIFCMSHHS